MITNNSNIPFLLAVAIISSDYDYNNDPYVVSATTLLKPTRMLVLNRINVKKPSTIDVQDLVAAFLGHAAHDKLERTWTDPDIKIKWQRALVNVFGWKVKKVKKILINPRGKVSAKQLKNTIYLEKRAHRKLGKYTVSGKYDAVIFGVVSDLKSTKAYKIQKLMKELPEFNQLMKDKNESGYRKLLLTQQLYPTVFEYTMQGSIYRWLEPNRIKGNHTLIQTVIKDYSAYLKDIQPSMSFKLKLFSKQATKRFIKTKLDEYDSLCQVTKQSKLPRCTDTDLWMSKPEYKYFSNPKAKRATKVFHQDAEGAYALLEAKGVGEVRVTQPSAKRCNYCDHINNCDQAAKLIKLGILVCK